MNESKPPETYGDFLAYARSEPNGNATIDAAIIIAKLIMRIGMTDPGWGVDVLINASAHIIGIQRATTFSTVDYWYRNVPRTWGFNLFPTIKNLIQ